MNNNESDTCEVESVIETSIITESVLESIDKTTKERGYLVPPHVYLFLIKTSLYNYNYYKLLHHFVILSLKPKVIKSVKE